MDTTDRDVDPQHPGDDRPRQDADEAVGLEVSGVEESGVEESGIEESGVEESGVEETAPERADVDADEGTTETEWASEGGSVDAEVAEAVPVENAPDVAVDGSLGDAALADRIPTSDEAATTSVPVEPTTEVVPVEPATDVMPTVPATEVVPVEATTEVAPVEPATDVMPTVPETDVVPTVPRVPLTQGDAAAGTIGGSEGAPSAADAAEQVADDRVIIQRTSYTLPGPTAPGQASETPAEPGYGPVTAAAPPSTSGDPELDALVDAARDAAPLGGAAQAAAQVSPLEQAIRTAPIAVGATASDPVTQTLPAQGAVPLDETSVDLDPLPSRRSQRGGSVEGTPAGVAAEPAPGRRMFGWFDVLLTVVALVGMVAGMFAFAVGFHDLWSNAASIHPTSNTGAIVWMAFGVALLVATALTGARSGWAMLISGLVGLVPGALFLFAPATGYRLLADLPWLGDFTEPLELFFELGGALLFGTVAVGFGIAAIVARRTRSRSGLGPVGWQAMSLVLSLVLTPVAVFLVLDGVLEVYRQTVMLHNVVPAAAALEGLAGALILGFVGWLARRGPLGPLLVGLVALVGPAVVMMCIPQRVDTALANVSFPGVADFVKYDFVRYAPVPLAVSGVMLVGLAIAGIADGAFRRHRPEENTQVVVPDA